MKNLPEIVEKLVSPIEKMIDCVKDAVGIAYKPRYERRMADSRAYEIQKISEAMRENSDIPIEYNTNGITLSSKDEEFIKRTQARMAYQEFAKQENIEAVAEKTYNLLEGEEKVTSKPVDKDWTLRFFNSIEDIGNEQMQEIWAKLLAGEIKKPGSFSLRTLSVLHNLNNQEATAFQEICQHCVIDNDSAYIFNVDDYHTKYSIPYGLILLLSECGLLTSGMVTVRRVFSCGESFVARTNDFIAFAHNSGSDPITIDLPVFPLTVVGVELINIIDCHMPIDEFKDIVRAYQQRASQITFSIHSIQKISEDCIEYNEEENLLTD